MSSAQPRGVVVTDSGRAQALDVLAVVADGRLSVAALSALLLKDPSRRVTCEAQGAGDVRAMLDAHRPQVVILDVTGSAFFALIDMPSVRSRTLLLLDPDDDSSIFAEATRAGIQGFLSRSASRSMLEAAIATLYREGAYLDPLLVGMREREATVTSALSLRETEILVGIANGRSTKEIAREYAITPKTVANHVNNMSQKLNFRHRGQLVLYAAQRGLTTI